MMRVSKLMVVAVLTGTLGLIGCGDDSTSSAGSGGTAGSGGMGGDGGTGGTPEACSEGPMAETDETETGTGQLACVATLPFDLTVSFNATPVNALQVGENEFELQIEVAIDADTVNTVVGLALGATVLGVEGTLNATMGDSDPTPVVAADEDVPCELEFVEDQDAVVVTTVSQGTWTLDEGSTLELTLEALTQLVEAVGLPVTLTTEGEEPTCEFVGDMPSVQFTIPE